MLKLIIICVLLLLLHFATKWLEARQNAIAKNAPPPGLFAYIESAPAQTAIAIIGSIASFIICDEMQWLNPATAGACGYMGSSIAENLVNQYAKVIGQK